MLTEIIDAKARTRPPTASAVPSFGEFLQPDPQGYEDSPNLYAYVLDDPVNLVDPNGTDAAWMWSCYGSGCASSPNASQYANSSQFGYWESQPVTYTWDPGTQSWGPVITAPKWVSYVDVSMSSFQLNIDYGRLAGRLGDALDVFAEDFLKPPSGRQEGESFGQCMNRIAPFDVALGISGASGIFSGAALLGYPRTPLAGGGSGTSLISSASRGSFGDAKLGFELFKTASVGGAIGRGLSTASVGTGAAILGYAAGHGAGTAQVCSK